MKKRIVFMGSPEFSVPSLSALINSFDVIGVVTQPDRPAGRGKKIKTSPVKKLALAKNIPLIQPKRLKDEGVYEKITSWAPDIVIVVAFGQILRSNILELPRFGCINVHASLLPRWRGAAPIQAAIFHGDLETGVTIMKMDSGIDTGPILTQRSIEILPGESAESLSDRLSILGAELLIKTIEDYEKGTIIPQNQESGNATYAPMIKKEDGKLGFHKSAIELERQIRAYHPWPGCFIKVDTDRIKIINAEPVMNLVFESGEMGIYDSYPVVGTSHGVLMLKVVQPEGKKQMSGDVFLRGYRKWITNTIIEE
jgi:methionyl-tRNA formyltransferase